MNDFLDRVRQAEDDLELLAHGLIKWARTQDVMEQIAMYPCDNMVYWNPLIIGKKAEKYL